MKSGRGGGRAGAGRPATGRGERISYQPRKENLDWLRREKKERRGKSYSVIIDRLIDREREK